MSGCPRWASVAPSHRLTSACTIDCGCTTTSIDSYGTPNRWWASISSSPLFISVAESTVIFPPICQVGCASASSTVTESRSVRPRNGPPLAVSTRRSTVPGRSPSSSWNRAECSESTGISWAPVASASAVTSSPPTTRLSLLASARSIPSPSAATVGPSPAEPTRAFRTRSQSVSPITPPSPSGPLSTDACSPARAAAPGLARASLSTPKRPACSSSSSQLEPAARPAISSSPLRSTTSSACVPIDPVDPTMRTRLTKSSVGSGLSADHGQQRLHDPWVELGAGHAAQLRPGLVLREGGPVRPRRGHRLVGVTGEDDAGARRYLLAGQPVGIARAVPALVGAAHDRQHVREKLHRRQDLLPDHRVALHDLALLGGERPGLVQDRLRHGQLSDVVEGRPVAQRAQLPLGHPEQAPDRLGAAAERARVLGGVRGLCLARPP